MSAQNLISINNDSDVNLFKVLKETLYPGSSDAEASMVLAYCKAKKIDPMLKPIHLVPMNVKSGRKDSNGKDIYEWRNVVMPGIGSYRIDAARTGKYAGMSEPEFGDDIHEKLGGIEVTYPKWCKVTVKKLIGNQIVEFTAKEYWKENYATAGKGSDAPNNMWKKRAYGQLAKCTEAQALRKAFPESITSEPTGEEMEGKHFKEEVFEKPNFRETREQKLIVNDPVSITDEIDKISKATSLTDLKEAFTEAKRLATKEDIEAVINAKDARKIAIEIEERKMVEDFNAEIDEETGEIH
jgi:phage recombination protein Bet